MRVLCAPSPSCSFSSALLTSLAPVIHELSPTSCACPLRPHPRPTACPLRPRPRPIAFRLPNAELNGTVAAAAGRAGDASGELPKRPASLSCPPLPRCVRDARADAAGAAADTGAAAATAAAGRSRHPLLQYHVKLPCSSSVALAVVRPGSWITHAQPGQVVALLPPLLLAAVPPCVPRAPCTLPTLALPPLAPPPP